MITTGCILQNVLCKFLGAGGVLAMFNLSYMQVYYLQHGESVIILHLHSLALMQRNKFILIVGNTLSLQNALACIFSLAHPHFALCQHFSVFPAKFVANPNPLDINKSH